jgi:hypothetical protein
MPEPITKQLMELREKPDNPPVDNAARAVTTALGEAMRAVRDLRSGEAERLERSSSGYGQVDKGRFEEVKEPASEMRDDAREHMNDAFVLLRKKEIDLCRVREEIEALRLVIPLLVEEPGQTETVPSSSTAQDANAGLRKAAKPISSAQDSTATRRKGWLKLGW